MRSSFAKNVLQLALIVGCSAFLTTSASATAYGSWSGTWSWSGSYNWSGSTNWHGDYHESDYHDDDEDTDGWSSWGGGSNYDWGDREHLHYSGCGHQYERPETSIPEPTAALLFATGGLVVAHGVRRKRGKHSSRTLPRRSCSIAIPKAI